MLQQNDCSASDPVRKLSTKYSRSAVTLHGSLR
ncbi:hypothetical protein SAMN04489733_3715 [Amycolatopsis keratiniphila]|nr:hypothetical protein SAMN04489733_3715 [Amycolatopsis keratiniphila]